MEPINEKIYGLRDEFVALHTEYKTTVTDGSNPLLRSSAATSQHHSSAVNVSHSRLTEIVDRMLDILLQVVTITTHYNATGKGHTLGNNLPAIEMGSDQQDDGHVTSRSTARVDDLYPEVRLDVPRQEGDDAEFQQADTKEVEGGLQDIRSPSDLSPRSISGSIYEDEEDQKPDQAVVDGLIENLKAKPTDDQKRGRPRGKGSRWKFHKIKSKDQLNDYFDELTAGWLVTGTLRLKNGKKDMTWLTPDQMKDIYSFYLQHHKVFPVKMIERRCCDKYGASLTTIKKCIATGRHGKPFTRNPKKTKLGRPSKLMREHSDKLQEIVKYAKQNPLNISIRKLAERFEMSSSSTTRKVITKLLKQNGIKIYTAAERRAIKLNMEGKEYKPFYATPEVRRYHSLKASELRKRRKEGDKTDGRSLRHKDPNWVSMKDVAGVPDGVVIYKSKSDEEAEEDESGHSRRASTVAAPGRRRRQPKKKIHKESLHSAASQHSGSIQSPSIFDHDQRSVMSCQSTCDNTTMTNSTFASQQAAAAAALLQQHNNALQQPQPTTAHQSSSLSSSHHQLSQQHQHLTHTAAGVMAGGGWQIPFDPLTASLQNLRASHHSAAAASSSAASVNQSYRHLTQHTSSYLPSVSSAGSSSASSSSAANNYTSQYLQQSFNHQY